MNDIVEHLRDTAKAHDTFYGKQANTVYAQAAAEIERLRIEIEQLENVLGLAIHELHGMESDELHRRYWALMNRSLISTSEKDHD